jgi:hypothetical protein
VALESHEPSWWLTKDGDAACLALYERHYPARRYRDGRRRRLFCGPGEKVVLRTADGCAFFVWRKFRDDCIDERTKAPQEGVNCSSFRNEGTGTSSGLIREADEIADVLWADRRHYTYVDPARVRSTNPGYCFLCAGWQRCGRTKSGLLIFERVRSLPMPTALYYADTREPGNCRSCEAPIEFARNVKTGKRMPFNAPIVALRTSHEPETHRLIEEVDLAQTHFATCPKARKHRTPR